MPELPEVETTCRGIEPFVSGKKIASFEIRNPGLRWPVPVAALQAFAGETVRKVDRRGKYIRITCDPGMILVHLGMSGSLRVLTVPEAPKKHDHVDMIMEDGAIIRFNDPRRFGCWLYQPSGAGEHELLSALGPEPLGEDFTADYLFARSRGRTQSIKTFIMDSHVVVGVGNIYAAEALFMAGIHPKRAAGKVSRERYGLLVAAIRKVLVAAIRQGGTTLRDYVNTDGKPGYFRQQLFVYGRQGEACRACSTPVKSIQLGQRSTFYCPACQK